MLATPFTWMEVYFFFQFPFPLGFLLPFDSLFCRHFTHKEIVCSHDLRLQQYCIQGLGHHGLSIRQSLVLNNLLLPSGNGPTHPNLCKTTLDQPHGQILAVIRFHSRQVINTLYWHLWLHDTVKNTESSNSSSTRSLFSLFAAFSVPPSYGNQANFILEALSL